MLLKSQAPEVLAPKARIYRRPAFLSSHMTGSADLRSSSEDNRAARLSRGSVTLRRR
jgi:hypothetical protein